ncbi:transglycosylase SLT domain-containing protein [Marilutibacter chinensis]|uniref:lytic transglycosylase domain-containing protein n=1 Tax=Marilutibacter chinensis TaxID=2912247 RepID=UPI003CCD2F15
MEMMGCWDLAVPGEIMRHVVQVESSFNPYAIGVVGGRLVRQPRSLAEALATARMLEEKGYNFSVGLAQVNRYNLAKYGLSSYERAFQTCPNLQAGARILAECHQRADGDWGKAFSCYYSGNFVTGFRHGYVQKVMASMGTDTNAGVQAISLAAASPRAAGGARPSRAVATTASLLTRRMQPEAAAPPPVTAPTPPASPADPDTAGTPSSSWQPVQTLAAQAPGPGPVVGQMPEPAPVKVQLVGAPPSPPPTPISASALPPSPAAGSASADAVVASSTPAGSAVSGSTASKEGGRDEAFVF